MSSVTERTKCPVCESISVKILYSNLFLKEPIITYLNKYYSNNSIDFGFLGNEIFLIEECLQCGFFYQKNILNDEYMKKFYDDWLTLPGETAVRQSPEFYRMITKELDLINKHFAKAPRFRVLDFGAGWGEWSKMAQAFGADVYALELSEGKKKHLELNGIRTLSWQEIKDHRFDFINTEQVFEHITDPHQTLQYLSKSLSENGIIKLSVPNGIKVKNNLVHPDWYADRFGAGSLMPIQPLEHINCFTKASLESLAKRSHLKQIDLRASKRVNDIIELSVKDILRPIYRSVTGKMEFNICCYFKMSR